MQSADRYFSALPTSPNTVVTWVPTKATAVMMTTAMRLAINAYSIAVAPVSSRRNIRTDFILILLSVQKRRILVSAPCLEHAWRSFVSPELLPHSHKTYDDDDILMYS